MMCVLVVLRMLAAPLLLLKSRRQVAIAPSCLLALAPSWGVMVIAIVVPIMVVSVPCPLVVMVPVMLAILFVMFASLPMIPVMVLILVGERRATCQANPNYESHR
jgi:hypothetical protein